MLWSELGLREAEGRGVFVIPLRADQRRQFTPLVGNGVEIGENQAWERGAINTASEPYQRAASLTPFPGLPASPSVCSDR